MKPTNNSIFLYLVTISKFPDNYIPTDCMQSAVVSSPSPGMALSFLQHYDMSNNCNVEDFWHKYGKIEQIGIIPKELNQESRIILDYWRSK